MKSVVIVHGGAGVWRKRAIRRGVEGVRAAAARGLAVMNGGGNALDAVEASVCEMEDNPIFNAGLGSALNLAGKVEMDASIMDGRNLAAGAVTLVRDIKNPVRLARLVMERTDHVLMGGEGAERLAELFGLLRRSPITKRRRNAWSRLRRQLRRGEIHDLRTTSKLIREFPQMLVGTVGAVAMDRSGNLAAATSTGGRALKLPGRIGDTPIIGAGTYADNKAGGASVTGIGEGAMRMVLAKVACDLMRRGASAQNAAEKCVTSLYRRIGWRIGVITVDKRGRTGAAHSTDQMCWAQMREGMREAKGAIRAGRFRFST